MEAEVAVEAEAGGVEAIAEVAVTVVLACARNAHMVRDQLVAQFGLADTDCSSRGSVTPQRHQRWRQQTAWPTTQRTPQLVGEPAGCGRPRR